MYSFKINQKQLADLWRAREYLGKGPMAKQVREAVDRYLRGVEAEIGSPIQDIADAIQQHETEEAAKKGPQEY